MSIKLEETRSSIPVRLFEHAHEQNCIYQIKGNVKKRTQRLGIKLSKI